MSFRCAHVAAAAVIHLLSGMAITVGQTTPFDNELPEFVGNSQHQLTAIIDESESAAGEPFYDDSELQRRIAALEASLSSSQRTTGVNVLATLDAQLDQQNRGRGGLFGSVEVTFLRPRVSGALPSFYFAGHNGRTIDPDYDPGLRFQLGYRSDSGLGVRTRYWYYDHTSPFVPPSVPAQLTIQMETFDNEVTFAQNFRNWDLEVSGGIRYGKLHYSTDMPALLGIGTLLFEGVGPTASLEGRRRLGTTGLALMGNVRGSLLMGEIRNASILPTMPQGTIKDEIAQIFENQLGVVWTRALGHSWQLELKTAWETQFWLNDTLADDAMGFGSNLAFTGPTIAVELKY